jgi:hypothetical protein
MLPSSRFLCSQYAYPLCGCCVCSKAAAVRNACIKRQLFRMLYEVDGHHGDRFKALDEFLWLCQSQPRWMSHLSQCAEAFTVVCNGEASVTRRQDTVR